MVRIPSISPSAWRSQVNDARIERVRDLWAVFVRLAAVKSGYFILLLLSLALWGNLDVRKFYEVRARWPRDRGPIFASHFATWDAAHYLILSENGYEPELPSCAFYPLWPLLVRGTGWLVGGSHWIVGLILANVLSLAGWALFYSLAKRRWGDMTAVAAITYLIAFPGALFFQFNYSESLFFLLAIVLWRGLELRKYGWACVAAFLLPLSRGVGAFVVLPIAAHVVVRAVEFHKRLLIDETAIRAAVPSIRRQFAICALLLLAPVAGWLFYLGLMWIWTGNPLEGIQAQKYWGVHSIGNLINVPKFVISLLSPTTLHDFSGSILDRSTFLGFLFCLGALWRTDKQLVVWAYVLGILTAMSGEFTSYTRYAGCNFPMFIALAVMFRGRGQRSAHFALLGVFILVHIALLWRFVNFRWAG